MEARIKKLEDQLKNVKIISKEEIATDRVTVGCRVKILDLDYNEEMEYRIASSVESNASDNTISDESPVGKGLIGHKVGECVEIHAPAATFKLKILEIGL